MVHKRLSSHEDSSASWNSPSTNEREIKTSEEIPLHENGFHLLESLTVKQPGGFSQFDANGPDYRAAQESHLPPLVIFYSFLFSLINPVFTLVNYLLMTFLNTDYLSNS